MKFFVVLLLTTYAVMAVVQVLLNVFANEDPSLFVIGFVGFAMGWIFVKYWPDESQEKDRNE